MFPEQAMSSIAVYMNEKGTRSRITVAWRFHFEGRTLLMMSRGQRWRVSEDDPSVDATLDIRVNAREWVRFLSANARDWSTLPVTLEGPREQQAEFKRIFGRRHAAASQQAPARSIVSTT